MMSNVFVEPEEELTPEDTEEIAILGEVIQYLQSLSEEHRYLDDYNILVTDACTEPFIIMSSIEFDRLTRKVVGV